MSLIRSSMIAGVTTGLLGIGAMALGDKESYKEPYFWTATVSTAIVGGLAWAILNNEKIEEALDLDAEYVFAKKVSVFADDEDEAHDELGYIHEKEYELIEINDEDSPYEAEYDFKNHAITTVVADDEDEAWDNFAKLFYMKPKAKTPKPISLSADMLLLMPIF